ncbi:MAG: alpha/beta hydrolase [Rhodospirillum sp.]|nr:alpha/beta hydrolase [Rhodospirillum sp.]MCF8490591.1 alpha/beta hydrolase [Rhodospirillum sp.]MCF8498962.1 alpha/beta hydrolase [Rhodospirillum sp.]
MIEVLATGALGLLILWLLAVGLLLAYQRKLQYRTAPGPLPNPDEVGVPEMIPVTTRTEDGLDLVAWYRAAASEGAPTVVLFHGNAGHIGDRERKARFILDAGLGVLLVEWRGYGGNPGEPSESGLLADGRAALAFLRGQGVSPDRWVFFGESLGSGVAFKLAAEGPAPAAIVTEGAFTSAVDVGVRRYPLFPVRFLMKDRFDSLSLLPGLATPLLVLHGQKDRVVPPDMGLRLATASPGPVETFFPSEGGHVDLFDHGAGPILLTFLKRYVSMDG